MVFFICNKCGESVKKPKVETHLYKCHGPPDLSCVDCNKNFPGQLWRQHTTCISEDQKYGGLDYVAKPNSDKGARKQQLWVEHVQRVIQNSANQVAPNVKAVLQRIATTENVPRKKDKFANFLQSAFHVRQSTVVEQVWNLMEQAKANMRNDEESAKADSNKQKPSKSSSDSDTGKPASGMEGDGDGDSDKPSKSKSTSSLLSRGSGSDAGYAQLENDADTPQKPSKKKDKKNKKAKLTEKNSIDSNTGSVDSGNDSVANGVENASYDSAVGSNQAHKSSHKSFTDCGAMDVDEVEGEGAQKPEFGSPSTKSGPGVGDGGMKKFKWMKRIKDILRSSPNKEMKVRKLRKTLMKEYLDRLPSTAEAIASVDKKEFEAKMYSFVTKSKKVRVEEDTVHLMDLDTSMS